MHPGNYQFGLLGRERETDARWNLGGLGGEIVEANRVAHRQVENIQRFADDALVRGLFERQGTAHDEGWHGERGNLLNPFEFALGHAVGVVADRIEIVKNAVRITHLIAREVGVGRIVHVLDLRFGFDARVVGQKFADESDAFGREDRFGTGFARLQPQGFRSGLEGKHQCERQREKRADQQRARDLHL